MNMEVNERVMINLPRSKSENIRVIKVIKVQNILFFSGARDNIS